MVDYFENKEDVLSSLLNRLLLECNLEAMFDSEDDPAALERGFIRYFQYWHERRKRERFAWVMPNNSGCCGAALLRGKHGENMVSINAMMPYWFAPTFKSYVGREQELPFDQHMLLALVAPRKLYVTSGSEDYWADPAGEHRSTVLANQVFRLYGSPTMLEAFPEENSPVHAGAQGYHLRTGPHLLTEYDWMGLLDHIDGIPGSTH